MVSVDSSGTLHIAETELRVGVARRNCPYCDAPVVIRVQTLQPVKEDVPSPSLELDIFDLTPRERTMFDVVYAHFPHAVLSDDVVATFGPSASRSLIKNLVCRMQPKLARQGWRMVSRRSVFRLEPISNCKHSLDSLEDKGDAKTEWQQQIEARLATLETALKSG